MRRACVCGSSAGLDDRCEECRRERLTGQPSQLRPGLRIGPADDRYERQADRVADAVMRMPATGSPPPLGERITPLVQRQPVDEGEEEDIQAMGLQRQAEPEDEEEEAIQATRLQRQADPEDEEEEAILQAKREAGGNFRSGAALVGTDDRGGRALPGSTRAFFESRLGFDFSQVRIHTGSAAAASTRRVHARAYTVGRNIVFGEGEYAPGGAAGQRLLAHELTHVVQQQAHLGRAENAAGSGRLQRQAAQADAEEEATVCEPDRPLSWDDFQGATKKKDAKHGATTALSFPEATSAPDVTFKVVFHPEHSSAKAGAKDPANRKQTGCAKRIKKCKKALTDHPGGWYGLSGEPNPNCHASPVPDSAIRATTKAACKSNIGAECDRVAALESERLLRHEQLHFDTGCVLVKKANAAIAAGTDATTAHEALEKSFVSVSKDYDGVTNNGCDAEQQAAWETKVGEGLPEVTIP